MGRASVLIGAVALLCAALSPFATAAAEDRPLKDFFGTYVGRSISDPDEGLSERDLSITIKSYKSAGFTVHWTTVIRRADGDVSRKSYTINFAPSDRPGIYGSEMRTNMFGGSVPLDPLQGEPYFWARIRGDTMTVFGMAITDAGGYELQIYDRTLIPGGLDLRFSRFRDGQALKLITGRLEKTGS